jgi:hypothetical protein
MMFWIMYGVLGGWIIVLSMYLAHAFREIKGLEKRIETLGNDRKADELEEEPYGSTKNTVR